MQARRYRSEDVRLGDGSFEHRAILTATGEVWLSGFVDAAARDRWIEAQCSTQDAVKASLAKSRVYGLASGRLL